MSLPLQMNPSVSYDYSDHSNGAMNRHDYAVQKNRKVASTGGGRAWNEDEEVYLLQTRLQKMPYKHIAAHLKKTELACRLHYHQLSHGSNRRKRTASVCSSGSMVSADMGTRKPSPVHEYSNSTPSPPMPYRQAYNPIQLPSASTLFARSISNSPPRLAHQPILPKPTGPRRSNSETTAQSSLRLDCAFPNPATQQNANADINHARLHAIYSNHRHSFWHAIALEYGDNVSPAALEAAFLASAASHGMVVNSPPTPSLSPNPMAAAGGTRRNSYPVKEAFGPPLPAAPAEHRVSATSISALLGIDASPRSPRERELIKRMEASRDVIMGGVDMH